MLETCRHATTVLSPMLCMNAVINTHIFRIFLNLTCTIFFTLNVGDKWKKLTNGWKLNPDKLKLEMKHMFLIVRVIKYTRNDGTSISGISTLRWMPFCTLYYNKIPILGLIRDTTW